MKLKQASKELLETHYEDLKAKPFFPGLIQYMSSGPVVPMVSFSVSRVSSLRARGHTPEVKGDGSHNNVSWT